MSKKASAATQKRADLLFDGEVTIQRVAELKTQLSEALAGTDCLTLNLKDVSRADLTFLQLLCSAHRTAQKAGKEMCLAEIPDAVEKAVADAGFIRENMGCGQECSDNCLWIES